MVNLIVAVDKSNSIGWSNGSLPWKIPLDMARFKALTLGREIIMGWNTFKSLGNPLGLAGRKNHVVTKKTFEVLAPFWGIDYANFTNSAAKWKEIPVNIVNHPEDWILAHQACLGCESKDLWVIGGAELYFSAIECGLVDTIYLTQVHSDSKADIKFQHSIYDTDKFIERQKSKGFNWEVSGIETPIILVGPSVTFMTLKRKK